MDKFIKILRIILIIFFIIWIVSWASIRAFKLNKTKEVGFLNNALVELHNVPYIIYKYFKKDGKPYLAVDISNTDNLYKIGEMSDLNYVNDSIYLLHYVFINKKEGKVVLQNIKNGDIALDWNIPLNYIMNDIDSIRNKIDQIIDTTYQGKTTKEKLHYHLIGSLDGIIITQPTLLKDSSLVFNTRLLNRIYKLNKYSKLVWKSNKLAHHSIELDEVGNIWAPSVNLNNETSIKYKYRDDAILCLDEKGNELYYKSLTELFKENNLFKSFIEATPIYAKAGLDPFHLNDIQPVKSNTEFWKKGDVFLSIRNKSILALLRPSINKILWVKQGYWNMQHDVDIKNDSIISVFNNNVSFLDYKVNGSSNILSYNFRNEKQEINFKDIFKSETQGRQTTLKNRDIFIEATDSGLYYILDSLGRTKANFYVPYKPQPQFAQYPGWARVYLKKNGEFIEQ